MRSLGDEALKLRDQYRRLAPPYGTVAVGAAHFDMWIKGYALDEYVSALRAGLGPQAALERAHAYRRDAIEIHNGKRSDYTWKRADVHCADFLNRKAAPISRLGV